MQSLGEGSYVCFIQLPGSWKNRSFQLIQIDSDVDNTYVLACCVEHIQMSGRLHKKIGSRLLLIISMIAVSSELNRSRIEYRVPDRQVYQQGLWKV